jgi:cytochrome c oxidase assembly factor CtaG
MVDAMTAPMTTTQLLSIAWEFEASVCIGCPLLIVIYFWRVRAGFWRRLCFILGIVVMFVSLESPIDTLGESYLFSIHMAQHLLLILIVAPLLLLGLTEESVREWLRHPRIAWAESILGRPVVAWCAGMGVMTAWHLPVLYNYALAHETIHIFQHLSFLVTATMFWWPVLHPIPERRLGVGASVFYLFAAAAENSVLGIILTFMRVGHYPAYLHPVDVYPGALNLIRNGWGISAAYDQRLGGLLMWIPGCSIYFISILALLGHWYAQPDVDAEVAPNLVAQKGGNWDE